MKKNTLPNLKNTGIELYAIHTSSRRWVCFNCRVCFHKPPGAGLSTCLNCQSQMFYAGSAFRAPRKNDIKEWAKLEALIRSGVKFHYCGGNGQIKGMTVNQAKEIARKRVVKEFVIK